MIKSNRGAVRLFYLSAFLESLCFYAPVASLYRLEYGVSVFQITLIESVCFILSLLLEMPWGFVTARVGYKKTLLAAGALEVLAAVLFWRARGFGMFLAQRCVLAAAISGFSGCDVAYLCRLAGREQEHRVVGGYNAVGYGGLVAVGLLFPLARPLGYRGLAFLALAGTLGSVLLRLALPEIGAEPQDTLGLKEQAAALKKVLLGNRPFLAFVLCGAVLTEVEHTFTVFFASPAWAAAGISEQWYGLLNLALNLTGLAAGLCSARLARRAGPGRAVALCWALALGCCCALALGAGAAALLLALPLLRLAAESYRPFEQVFKNARTGCAGRAVALSAYNMAASVTGAAVGPLLGAGTGEGLQKGFAMGVCLLVPAALAAGICYKRMQKGNRTQ